MGEVQIHELKRVDLSGGTLIEGFPSTGLVGPISCSCLVSTLKLKQISVLDSDIFPSVSLVYRGETRFPARIYADEKAKIATVFGEFTPAAGDERVLGKAILSWAKDHGCSLIITSAGLPQKAGEGVPEGKALSVGNTANARRKIEQAGLSQLDVGAVGGLPGFLLNHGSLENFDVIALLTRAKEGAPDYQAGVIVAQAIDKLVPGAKCDTVPLLAEAKRSEGEVEDIRNQVKSTPPQMFR